MVHKISDVSQLAQYTLSTAYVAYFDLYVNTQADLSRSAVRSTTYKH